jgi:hypothetical protein
MYLYDERNQITVSFQYTFRPLIGSRNISSSLIDPSAISWLSIGYSAGPGAVELFYWTDFPSRRGTLTIAVKPNRLMTGQNTVQQCSFIL